MATPSLRTFALIVVCVLSACGTPEPPMCSAAVASDPRIVSPERTRASVLASAPLMTRIKRIGSTGAPPGDEPDGASFLRPRRVAAEFHSFIHRFAHRFLN